MPKRRNAGSSGNGAGDAISKRIDELYGLPVREFTAARNALAKALAAEKHGDAAAEVKRLPKPTVSLWAVNQLARVGPDAMRRLLDAWEEASRAQTEALRKGERGTLRQALESERKAIRDVLAAADRDPELAQAVSKHSEDIVAMLTAAVRSDDSTREQLRRGALHSAPEAGAFGFVGPMGEWTAREAAAGGKGAHPDRVPASEAHERAPSAKERANHAGAAKRAGRAERATSARVHEANPSRARTSAVEARKQAAAERAARAGEREDRAQKARAEAARRREQTQLQRELSRAREQASRAAARVRELEKDLDEARSKANDAEERASKVDAQLRALEEEPEG